MAPKIQIEIDTDDLLPTLSHDWDGEEHITPGPKFEELVVDALARQIANADQWAARVRREADERIQSSLTAKIDAALETLVDGVIEEPIQRRHPWGDKEGEPITVREIVRERVEKFFTSKGSRDQYGSRGRETGIDQLVQNLTRDALDKELSAEVDNVRKQVRTTIRDKALQAAVDAITPRTH